MARERRFHIINYANRSRLMNQGIPSVRWLTFMGKYLADWFLTVSNFKPSHTIKNSSELAGTLPTHKFPASSKLLSFNAISIFTRISVQRAISMMIEHLRSNNIPSLVINEFERLLSHVYTRTCVSSEDP